MDNYDYYDSGWEEGYSYRMNNYPTNYEKVREFHKAFGAALDQPISQDLVNLRIHLIEEEGLELGKEFYADYASYPCDAYINPPDKAKVAKELADLLYVVYGTAATFGIDIDRVFDEVHKSNMSKLGEDGKPVYREDGKVLKGPNYTPPNLEWVK